MTNFDPFGNPDQPAAGDGFEFDIDVNSAALPPEGDYMVRCIDVSKSTSQSGNPMMVWDFALENAPGKTVRSWTSLQENARWKVLEYAEALGVSPDSNGQLRFNRASVIGQYALATLEHRTFNGRTNLSVRSMRRPNEAELREIVAGEGGVGDIPY